MMGRWIACFILTGLMLGTTGCGGDEGAAKAPAADVGGPKLPGADDANIDMPKKGAAR